jgi:DNA-binding NarL/FixJ family response regulator
MSASKGSKIPDLKELSPLELTILRSLSRGKSVPEVARLVNVAPAKVGNEIAVLQLKGYLSSDGSVTGKGLTVLEG